MNYTLTPPPPPSPTPSGFRDADDNDEEPVHSVRLSNTPLHRNRYAPPPSDSAAFLSPNPFSSSQGFLFRGPDSSARSSVCSTAATTPAHSRSASPSQLFYSSAPSTCSSDTDSELASPLLTSGLERPWWREDATTRRRWWPVSNTLSPRRRRRGHSYKWGFRAFKRVVRRLCRHPFVPKQPVMILLTLLLLTAFGICMTLLIMHILNPDKEPLPWRFYCSIPHTSTAPPSLTAPSSSLPDSLPVNISHLPAPFPPADLDSLPPVGVFLGVFSLDSAIERRMLVRSTWASHKKSRDGGGIGDGGLGTSRTIVRFILGQPSREWNRRVRLEMEAYNDMVILPMYENMNAGKSHAYFTWAASSAWVPPHFESPSDPVTFSYSNSTSPAPRLAKHDPVQAWEDARSGEAKPWVKPDFVVKADDDSFVMLAELESRLRVQLYDEVRPKRNTSISKSASLDPSPASASSTYPASSMILPSNVFPQNILRLAPPYDRRGTTLADPPITQDPLIYWGYLVKNRFMAGELYALSWSLVDWVANDSSIKSMTKGAEDKQTAKWIRLHPNAEQVRWGDERCWIYDHPRAGTVYAHGFLFPSEVSRVKTLLFAHLAATPKVSDPGSPGPQQLTDLTKLSVTPSAWAHSSVSRFGTRYVPPLQDMSTWQSVEALVEGSDMSKIREDLPMTADYAWDHREGRSTRYAGKRVGGTAVVHFIKKNMWFMETALALLDMEEMTELEKYPESIPSSDDDTGKSSDSGNTTPIRPASSSPALHPLTQSADVNSASELPSTHYSITSKRHRKR